MSQPVTQASSGRRSAHGADRLPAEQTGERTGSRPQPPEAGARSASLEPGRAPGYPNLHSCSSILPHKSLRPGRASAARVGEEVGAVSLLRCSFDCPARAQDCLDKIETRCRVISMNLQHIRVACFRPRPGEAAPLWRAPFPAPLFGVSAEQTRFLLFFFHSPAKP